MIFLQSTEISLTGTSAIDAQQKYMNNGVNHSSVGQTVSELEGFL